MLELCEVVVEAIETGFPDWPVLLGPVGDLGERSGIERARAVLRVASASDEAGAFEHLEVLRNRGQLHVEWLSKFVDARSTGGQASEDRTARRVGEGRERGAQSVVVAQWSGGEGCCQCERRLDLPFTRIRKLDILF